MKIEPEIENNTYIIRLEAGTTMTPLLREDNEYFTKMLERNKEFFPVIINASFIDLPSATKLSVYTTGTAPVPRSEAIPNGHVVSNGKIIIGSQSKGEGKFYFAFNENKNPDREARGRQSRYFAGTNNAPTNVTAAISGLIPIIINGLPYGTENIWNPQTPAPINQIKQGMVPANQMQYLTRKSARAFGILAAEGRKVGKVAVGHNTEKDQLIILVQPQGYDGKTADEIREFYVRNGAQNAVFMDCSDSATLMIDQKLRVSPGDNKNEFINVAIGFKPLQSSPQQEPHDRVKPTATLRAK